MTKTNYELMAKTLERETHRLRALIDYHISVKEDEQAARYEDMLEGAERVIFQLAVALEDDNPRFNKELFYTACGIPE